MSPEVKHVMPGRRVPDGTPVHAYAPGDYGRRGTTWWAKIPSGVLHCLNRDGVGPSHTWSVDEHEDMTITVTPSIWDAPNGWHGWLRHGTWTEA